jgi:hypothetical protein
MPLDHGTVSIPAGFVLPLLRWLLPPRIQFGSASQRGKNEQQSYWHIPIKIHRRCLIGPGELPNCRVYLDEYEDDAVVHKIRMAWGDAVFTGTTATATLAVHEVLLVPIVLRTESGDDRSAHIASLKYLRDGASETILAPDRRKFRFKLRVQVGNKRFISEHSYIVRVPKGRGNGHFTCEVEYEGEGTV